MVSGLESVMESEIISGMVPELVSELEMASGILSESQLIGHVCFEVIHIL